jgi:hypothetical protein
MAISRPRGHIRGYHAQKGEEGYVVPSGLGVRREDESAVGAGREGGPRPCGVEGESSIEVWRW